MRYPTFVRAAALVLPAIFLGGGAIAQSQPPTMTDTAPLPATERESLGAVILMDSPVLAQREAMLQATARAPDTRTMGAGPAEFLNRAIMREDAKKKPLDKTPK